MGAFKGSTNNSYRSDHNTYGKRGKVDPLELYREQALDHPVLTNKQFRELAEQASSGNQEAREQIITSNQKMIWQATRKIRDHTKADHIAEINLSLIERLETISPDLTHLTGIIRYARIHAYWSMLGQSGAINIPPGALKQYARMRDAIYGTKETEEDFAIVMEREYERLIRINPKAQRSEEDKEQLFKDWRRSYSTIQAILNPASLSQRARPRSSDYTIEETLGENTTEEDFSQNEIRTVLAEALNELKPNDAQVLRIYFGIDTGQKALTLEETGAILGVTRERARQRKERGLDQLRRNKKLRELVD